MSDQDPSDVFVRHRGAVLDALLSEPALTGAQGSAPATVPPVEDPLEPDFSPAGDAVPTEAVPTEAVPTGAVLTETMPTESRSDASSPPGAAARRAAGPSAGDRIMALLNGEAMDTAADQVYGSDFAGRAGAKLSPAAESAAAEPVPGDTAAESKADAAPQDTAKPSGSAESDPVKRLLTKVRNPGVALALAAVVLVVIVLVLVGTGGGKQDSTQVRVLTPAAGPSHSAAPSSAAPPGSGGSPDSGAALQVKSAQSHCPAGSTPGMDAVSGQADKAWSCVRAYHVDGQVLTIDLGQTHTIDSIGIIPGWDSVGSDGTDQWNTHRTVSRVSYRFNDPGATTYTQQTMDQRSLVTTKLSPAVTASKITLTVLESKGDPSVNTTAISSIVVTGQ
ncbi:MAG: hypothetical protein J2P18_16885 [Nocardia sp.]|nr:hypothetical protein [Nocardia sp.]